MDWQRFSNPTKLETVYRLVQKACTLPLHWAYGDPFDIAVGAFDRGQEVRVDVGGRHADGSGRTALIVIDRRVRGVQVWDDLDQVVRALAGEDMDGYYGPEEYPWVLRLVVRRLQWSNVGGWHHVEPEDVAGVWQVRSRAFMNRVMEAVGVDDYDELLEHRDSLDESVLAFQFDKMARWCRPKWVETLDPKDWLSPSDLALPMVSG